MLRSLCLSSILVTLAAARESVEFNRDIRPILTEHCTACHGGVKEAGGVSYIYREKALAKAESGARPIVPGNPAASEMLRRLRSTDPELVMPHPKHGPPLPAEQIALIERWISEGAKWQDHWSFVPPENSVITNLSDETWPSSALDRFILARLDRENLKPSPEAGAAEWLRRASFDLIGLPPSPEELAAFEAALATGPAAARAAVADRLLASPRFGERWASVWLDLARYSDTYGFEKDPHRDIWPFRDWVIRAFNSDMPFDRFTIEQLAGDLLPSPTADQRLATAFHRNTQTNAEGGTDDEEFRVAAVIDRATTTWTTWQATTFGCVQCHSHPYDPIRHDEFYRFIDFFNNTEDCDQDDDYPKLIISPEASATDLELRLLRTKLNDPGRALALEAGDWKPFTPDSFTPSHGTLTPAPDGRIRGTGTFPVGNTHIVSGPAAGFSAIRLRIFPDSDDPKKWPERGSLVTKFEAVLTDAAGVAVEVALKEAFADQLSGPVDPNEAIRGGKGAGDFPKLNGPRWFVFVPENPVTAPPGSRLQISMKQDGRTGGEQATPVRAFSIELSNLPQWTGLVHSPERRETWKSHDRLRSRLRSAEGIAVPIMRERSAASRRETRVFARGNRLSKEHPVSAGVPELIAGSYQGKEMTRLDMARWLVSPENPLTARVLANRLWGELFGTGIVETAEDFGTSGTPPSHPELLDHLALRLRDHHHWSVISLLREIILSSTYRQTHRATPEGLARDPRNRLLSRGPRQRLSAEMIRDQALAIAGLLSPEMYGPPVFPPQPAGVWSSVYSKEKWQDSTGGDRYRRGLYTYSKRTSGYPAFLTFDAPGRDLCSARRLPSNTPLQALVTLNDPAHIEAARSLGKRLAAISPDPRVRLARAVLLATQRDPSAETLDELVAFYQSAAADYEKDPAAAALLAEDPRSAALVLTVNTILNLDSSLNR